MTRVLLVVGLLAIASTLAMGAGPSASYVSGGTAVVKESGSAPAADDGVVVCGGEPSVGGACLPFGDLDSIVVLDDVSGRAVAFQVCIDNNGDGVCGNSPDDGRDPGQLGCSDEIFFSHDDAGRFFNPLGPLPTSFRAGCPGGPWHGYVVFLCEGVHVSASADGSVTVPAHAHAATVGTIALAEGGSGYGDFCRPPAAGPGKTYVIAGVAVDGPFPTPF